jgi:hypothetical protein
VSQAIFEPGPPKHKSEALLPEPARSMDTWNSARDWKNTQRPAQCHLYPFLWNNMNTSDIIQETKWQIWLPLKWDVRNINICLYPLLRGCAHYAYKNPIQIILLILQRHGLGLQSSYNCPFHLSRGFPKFIFPSVCSSVSLFLKFHLSFLKCQKFTCAFCSLI